MRFFASAQIRSEDIEPVDKDGKPIFHMHVWASDGPPKESILGKGTYGSVWRARDKHTGNLFAVKSIKVQRRKIMDVAMRECEVAEKLRTYPHPCVVRLFHVYHEEMQTYNLVMEFCPGGDLAGAVSKMHVKRGVGNYQPPAKALQWISQMFLGLEHLHTAMNTLLRDVKPENVVLNDREHAKHTDFGFSKLSAQSDGTQTFGVPPGTPAYVAPEVLKCERYDYRADLYSFGVVVWVLLSGGIWDGGDFPLPPCNKYSMMNLKPLLHNWELIEKGMRDGNTLGVPPIHGETAKDFISMLIRRGDKPSGATHADVRAHPYLARANIPSLGSTFQEITLWMDGDIKDYADGEFPDGEPNANDQATGDKRVTAVA